MGLLNQIAVNSLYRFIFLILQFLITIFVSRLIGPGGLGTYSLLFATANILLVFTSLGIPSGITFHSAKKDIANKTLVRFAFISAGYQLLFIMLIEFMHWMLSGKFLIWPASETMAGISGIFFFISIMITERYAALYNGNKQLHLFNLQLAIFSFLTLASLIYWTLDPGNATEFNVIALIIFIGVVQMISLGITYTVLPTLSQPDENVSLTTNAGFFTYSMLAWLANSIQFLVYRIDFWILNYFHGETELGLYALSVRIGQTFWIIPGLVASVILPHLVSLNFDAKILERMIRITNTANLLLALGIAVFAKQIIPVLFGSDFTGSALTLIILLPGVLFVSMHTLLAAYFAGKNKIRYNLQAAIVSLVLITVLDILLIPSMGRNGAAIASSIAYMAGCLYAMILYSRMENYSLSRLLVQQQDLQWLRQNVSRLMTKYKEV